MEVRVLFFARSRELAGTSEATLSLQTGSTTAALMPTLLKQASTARECRRLSRASHRCAALLRVQPRPFVGSAS